MSLQLLPSFACVGAQLHCHVRLFVSPWTVAHQAPLSMGFSRQEHWSGLPFPLSGDLPDPEIQPASPVSPALAGRFFTTEPPAFYNILITRPPFLLLICPFYENSFSFLFTKLPKWPLSHVQMTRLEHTMMAQAVYIQERHSHHVLFGGQNMCSKPYSHQWEQETRSCSGSGCGVWGLLITHMRYGVIQVLSRLSQDYRSTSTHRS